MPELVRVAPAPDTPLLYVAVRFDMVETQTGSNSVDIFFMYPLLVTWVSVDGSLVDTILAKVGELAVPIF